MINCFQLIAQLRDASIHTHTDGIGKCARLLSTDSLDSLGTLETRSTFSDALGDPLDSLTGSTFLSTPVSKLYFGAIGAEESSHCHFGSLATTDVTERRTEIPIGGYRFHFTVPSPGSSAIGSKSSSNFNPQSSTWRTAWPTIPAATDISIGSHSFGSTTSSSVHTSVKKDSLSMSAPRGYSFRFTLPEADAPVAISFGQSGTVSTELPSTSLRTPFQVGTRHSLSVPPQNPVGDSTLSSLRANMPGSIPSMPPADASASAASVKRSVLIFTEVIDALGYAYEILIISQYHKSRIHTPKRSGAMNPLSEFPFEPEWKSDHPESPPLWTPSYEDYLLDEDGGFDFKDYIMWTGPKVVSSVQWSNRTWTIDQSYPETTVTPRELYKKPHDSQDKPSNMFDSLPAVSSHSTSVSGARGLGGVINPLQVPCRPSPAIPITQRSPPLHAPSLACMNGNSRWALSLRAYRAGDLCRGTTEEKWEEDERPTLSFIEAYDELYGVRLPRPIELTTGWVRVKKLEYSNWKDEFADNSRCFRRRSSRPRPWSPVPKTKDLNRILRSVIGLSTTNACSVVEDVSVLENDEPLAITSQPIMSVIRMDEPSVLNTFHSKAVFVIRSLVRLGYDLEVFNRLRQLNIWSMLAARDRIGNVTLRVWYALTAGAREVYQCMTEDCTQLLRCISLMLMIVTGWRQRAYMSMANIAGCMWTYAEIYREATEGAIPDRIETLDSIALLDFLDDLRTVRQTECCFRSVPLDKLRSYATCKTDVRRDYYYMSTLRRVVSLIFALTVGLIFPAALRISSIGASYKVAFSPLIIVQLSPGGACLLMVRLRTLHYQVHLPSVASLCVLEYDKRVAFS